TLAKEIREIGDLIKVIYQFPISAVHKKITAFQKLISSIYPSRGIVYPSRSRAGTVVYDKIFCYELQELLICTDNNGIIDCPFGTR
ncbi:MAG: hypothetical protein MI748_14885, partial [Opitutales bacterium]|nr:hypothetical protein [Opitutales bacterium]